jgi:hypothetical protein
MKTNSKNIGNSFERQFSKELSLWCSNGENDDLFYRDLSSGARATVRKKQMKESANDGDIIATDLNYKFFVNLFFIDTKSYKEFYPIIINHKNIKSNTIFQQWVKVCNDCPKHKIPFMVCKIRDRKTPQFIIVPKYLIFNASNRMLYQLWYEGTRYEFYLVLQDEFFELNNYKDLYEKNKKSEFQI